MFSRQISDMPTQSMRHLSPDYLTISRCELKGDEKLAREQRQNPRVSLDVCVNYATNAIAHTKDLSESGICLITEQPLAVGKILHLTFELPGTPGKVEVFGKVVRTQKALECHHENGISFWSADEASWSILKDYLSRSVY